MKGIRWVALVLAAVLLGAALYTFAPWVAGLLGIAAAYGLVRYVIEVVATRDPYSIGALRDLEDKEELRRLLENEPYLDEEALPVCPCCHGVADPKTRVCRGCGKPL